MYWSKAIKKSKVLEELSNYFFTSIIYIIRFFVGFGKISNDTTVIIALRKLGDAVFTIPAIKEIQKYQIDKLFLICFPETEPIYRNALSNIDIITLAHDSFYLKDRFAKSSARRLIDKLNPGIIIDLTGVITSVTLIYASKSKKIIGANEKYFHAIYSDFILNPGNVHMVGQYLNIVKKHLDIEDNASSKEFECKIKKDGCILIHPFAGWKAKEWNFPKFVSLAKQINIEYNCLIVVPAGYMNSQKYDDIKNAGLNIIETKETDELISVINGCSVFISNDSGPLQIAALLGKPTFTIYGPTNPEYHIPFGKHHGFIQKMIECSPKTGEKFCFTNAGRDGCPSFECMNQLSVEEVTPQVMDFISILNIKQKIKQELNS
jgi:ADP-heptose:LPS heptosyltransferase